MTLPADIVGTPMPVVQAIIDRERLRSFAESTGETAPHYLELDAAHALGYPDLPAPPTFLFGLGLDPHGPFGWLERIGVPVERILHAGQGFVYHQLAFAGDEIELQPRVVDCYRKRDGALEFLVIETTATRAGEAIALLRETLVLRHAEATAK
ncbi:MaoC family dehydratase N-terminal domain-containing protein [Streptosporangium sp. NPDC006013]|uniref:MaoC family dehydratase N-terminal domain-containing protein n=1 Tax=Streptosporangium sp. NPDC006013 TaxID=3155596 RepID=UPI0033A529DB